MFLEPDVSGRCCFQNLVLVQHAIADFKNGIIQAYSKEIWIRLLKEYDSKIGIKWMWQSLDSISIKSPLWGTMTGSNPVDRSKLGTKRHILTDKKGIPLSAAISSASTHDIKLVTDVIDNSIIKRTFVSDKPKENETTEVSSPMS